ncbi:MAG: prophage maintenance system killer protein (DOC) [uncultured bacterium]|nr:MAG: prophage maintenance system killer protein (DOC) [uncultured bacterium]
MKKEETNKIIIYKDESGNAQIDVKVDKETVWLGQDQIAQLFDIQRPAITKHLANVYKSNELSEQSTCSILEHVGVTGQKYKTRLYNLDAIISVGYRVNSKRATQFRIWATNTLKNYLLSGYAVNDKKMLEYKDKLVLLKETITFIEKKADNYVLQDKSRELLSLLGEFAKSLKLLDEYDQGKIKIAKTTKAKFALDYEKCKNTIIAIKAELKSDGQAGDLFGQEYDHKFEAIISSIYQTFDSKELYNNIEEKAANLLYLTIKDHPFADGNKRIASILFVYFLKENNYLYTLDLQRKINNNTLVSLALLVATSDPKEKDVMIKIIISLLQ